MPTCVMRLGVLATGNPSSTKIRVVELWSLTGYFGLLVIMRRRSKPQNAPLLLTVEIRLHMRRCRRNHRINAPARVVIAAEGKPPFQTGQHLCFLAHRASWYLSKHKPF